MQNCQFRIHSQVSGYCYCKDNWKTPLLECNHRETSCEEECKSLGFVCAVMRRMPWMESDDGLFALRKKEQGWRSFVRGNGSVA